MSDLFIVNLMPEGVICFQPFLILLQQSKYFYFLFIFWQTMESSSNIIRKIWACLENVGQQFWALAWTRLKLSSSIYFICTTQNWLLEHLPNRNKNKYQDILSCPNLYLMNYSRVDIIMCINIPSTLFSWINSINNYAPN